MKLFAALMLAFLSVVPAVSAAAPDHVAYRVTVTFDGHVLESSGVPLIIDSNGTSYTESLRKVSYVSDCASGRLNARQALNGWKAAATRQGDTVNFTVHVWKILTPADQLHRCRSEPPVTIDDTFKVTTNIHSRDVTPILERAHGHRIVVTITPLAIPTVSLRAPGGKWEHGSRGQAAPSRCAIGRGTAIAGTDVRITCSHKEQ